MCAGHGTDPQLYTYDHLRRKTDHPALFPSALATISIPYTLKKHRSYVPPFPLHGWVPAALLSVLPEQLNMGKWKSDHYSVILPCVSQLKSGAIFSPLDWVFDDIPISRWMGFSRQKGETSHAMRSTRIRNDDGLITNIVVLREKQRITTSYLRNSTIPRANEGAAVQQGSSALASFQHRETSILFRRTSGWGNDAGMGECMQNSDDRPVARHLSGRLCVTREAPCWSAEQRITIISRNDVASSKGISSLFNIVVSDSSSFNDTRYPDCANLTAQAFYFHPTCTSRQQQDKGTPYAGRREEKATGIDFLHHDREWPIFHPFWAVGEDRGDGVSVFLAAAELQLLGYGPDRSVAGLEVYLLATYNVPSRLYRYRHCTLGLPSSGSWGLDVAGLDSNTPPILSCSSDQLHTLYLESAMPFVALRRTELNRTELNLNYHHGRHSFFWTGGRPHPTESNPRVVHQLAVALNDLKSTYVRANKLPLIGSGTPYQVPNLRVPHNWGTWLLSSQCHRDPTPAASPPNLASQPNPTLHYIPKSRRDSRVPTGPKYKQPPNLMTTDLDGHSLGLFQIFERVRSRNSSSKVISTSEPSRPTAYRTDQIDEPPRSQSVRQISTLGGSSGTVRSIVVVRGKPRPTACMTPSLESLFAELGISQYLASFVEQGFDTWETILDITESDLDVLGVKLGHRRKLQRRIANSRGLAPGAALLSAKISGSDAVRSENWRQESPDENAPERPPSAYVLFSNKMRDDLKGRNLTFTEIAKLVGEHWQSLSPAEKEPYETKAMNAKDKYNKALAEYKKTPEYRKYAQYLLEFKQRQASQNQAKDASKRLRLEPGARLHHGGSVGGTPTPSSTPTPTPTPKSANGTGSGSDGYAGIGIDTPLARKHRVRSSMPHASHQETIEDMVPSPASTHFDLEPSPLAHGSSGSAHSHSRRPTWSNSPANTENNTQLHLPSFSDMFNHDRQVMSGVGMGMGMASENSGFVGFGQGQQHASPHLPQLAPPQQMPHQMPQQANVGRPLVKHESPSTGSMGSSSCSMFSYQRTPSEASLPIHALLSSRSGSDSGYEGQPGSYVGQQQEIQGNQYPFPHFGQAAHAIPPPGAPGIMNGSHDSRPGRQAGGAVAHRPPLAGLQHMSSSSSGVTEASPGSHSSSQTSLSVYDNGGVSNNDMNTKGKEEFDGMNALLRAGEIVGRREE
ncbi:hypothetical protein SODALDRAFT_361656 [Sodiomyces alkalinus F11]|uniref:HMG box domain-containing protein n=1 Tax=Sodiomyces alkalinus (strain CBS 110278 / VKM F-3762 / F11) TaxID=1314773 RepID=A0A3N2PQP6_SODAK|nr:hypothetical protein SODALDRAFT_361656 [Sodiomyces alkalinus F11]ROT36832.1 hypothetical protein SODALDRAFT_361656 [Sodiomyces alkalinus F11]